MRLKLLENEKALVRKGINPPFRISRHWESLLDGRHDDPLRLQVVPSEMEFRHSRSELRDPLGEMAYSPLPRLVHRYPDRALVVATGRCALYCRHCFRRRLTGDDYAQISLDEIREIVQWLADHPEVKELILSGGDPLTLTENTLFQLLDQARHSRPGIVIRIATRIPIVDPKRISDKLCVKLSRRRPLWIVIQANHPRELSAEALKALDRLQRRGLPVVSQTVLLRGINDDVDILEQLCRDLVAAGVKPLYLFQGDLAEGTAHFRLPLDAARDLANQLRGRLGALSMPVFAVDLPGGGGKVPLAPDYVLGHDERGWRLKSPSGGEGYYKET